MSIVEFTCDYRCSAFLRLGKAREAMTFSRRHMQTSCQHPTNLVQFYFLTYTSSRTASNRAPNPFAIMFDNIDFDQGSLWSKLPHLCLSHNTRNLTVHSFCLQHFVQPYFLEVSAGIRSANSRAMLTLAPVSQRKQVRPHYVSRPCVQCCEPRVPGTISDDVQSTTAKPSQTSSEATAVTDAMLLPWLSSHSASSETSCTTPARLFLNSANPLPATTRLSPTNQPPRSSRPHSSNTPPSRFSSQATHSS